MLDKTFWHVILAYDFSVSSWHVVLACHSGKSRQFVMSFWQLPFWPVTLAGGWGFSFISAAILACHFCGGGIDEKSNNYFICIT